MNNLKNIINKNTFHIKYDVSIKDAMSTMIDNKNGCAILIKNVMQMCNNFRANMVAVPFTYYHNNIFL